MAGSIRHSATSQRHRDLHRPPPSSTFSTAQLTTTFLDSQKTMSGLTRVNQRSGERSRPNTPGYAGAGPSSGPGAGLGGPSGYGGGGSGAGAGLGGPGAGFGPGTGFGPGAGLAPGSGRNSPFPARAASPYSESPYGGGMRTPSHAYPSGHELEQHNDDLLSGLLGKVDTLKNLTIGIGKEVRDGNLELAGMNDSFGSTGNILSGTFKRMTKMAKRQGGNWCYFMLFLMFVVWIFIVVWWLRR